MPGNLYDYMNAEQPHKKVLSSTINYSEDTLHGRQGANRPPPRTTNIAGSLMNRYQHQAVNNRRMGRENLLPYSSGSVHAATKQMATLSP